MNINQTGAAILFAEHGTTWAVDQARFEAITHRIAAGQQTEREAPQAQRVGSSGGGGKGSALVLPIRGLLTKREVWYGGTAYGQIVGWLDEAVRQSVETIILDVDSGGGEVAGVIETAAAIRSIRDLIPVVAVVNSFAASAAYWLASQANEIVIAPSGEAGSVGVWTGHVDISKADAAAGIKVSIVKAGKYKVEGNPWEPLSKDARAEMQRSVDHYHRQFIEAVADGRGVSASKVRNSFGQGRVLRVEDALKVGMVDRVGTLDGTVRDVLTKAKRRRTQAAKRRTALTLLALESQM